jgi:hypothetical protein
MQQHPVVTYLRFLGLAIGAILFIFMVYHSRQMAKDPIYVRGKPSLQWVALGSQRFPRATDATARMPAEQAVAIPSPSPRQTVTEKRTMHGASGQVDEARQIAEPTMPSVKATGHQRHSD